MALTKKGFKAWLATKADDEVVGEVGRPDTCALAVYLLENGAVRPSVGSRTFNLDFPANTALLPAWAIRWVAKIDARMTRTVTAAEARAALVSK